MSASLNDRITIENRKKTKIEIQNKLKKIGNKMKKQITKVLDLASTIFTVIVFVLSILLVATRFIGLTPYSVTSGSMEPNILKGSLVYVKEIEIEDIKENMVITYIANESNHVVTHRVININSQEQELTTKGDSNEYEDTFKVKYPNVLGTVKYHLPLLGYASRFVHSIIGLTLITTSIGLILINAIFKSSLESIRKPKRKLKRGIQLNETKK